MARKFYHFLKQTARKFYHLKRYTKNLLIFSQTSSTGKYSCVPKIEPARKSFTREGNFQNVEQGSHCWDTARQRGVSKQPHSCQQERWGEPTKDKFEKSKRAFTIYGLHCLRNVLKKWDCMCKLDLKDAYSSITLNLSSRTFVQFPWWGKLYEFLCLGFGLGPAPKFFTKLMKITVAVLRLINILIIVYLDEMLLIDRTLQEPQMSKDTLIFLFKQLLFSM